MEPEVPNTLRSRFNVIRALETMDTYRLDAYIIIIIMKSEREREREKETETDTKTIREREGERLAS